MARVNIPTMLRPLVGDERVLVASGRTVREIITEIDRRHPGFAAQLVDTETGELRRFVNVYVNDEDVRYLQRLETPVDETDQISILPAVAGG
jgi:molybdopterin converting factor small subunit